MEASCCFKMALICLNCYHRAGPLRTSFGECLHHFSQSLSYNEMIDKLLFWKRCDMVQLKTEWICRVKLKCLKNSRKHSGVWLSAHFCLASHDHCLYIISFMGKKKKSLSIITCHQTSLCDNPSVCSPHCFVAQNQMFDSSKSLMQHMAYDIVYLNRNHSIRNTRVPTVINKR